MEGKASWVPCVPLLIAALIGAGCGSTARVSTARRVTSAQRAPTDFVVRAGRRELRGECRGPARAGKPTIVLEAGQGNDSAELASVASALGRRWRVCTYDRAGLGRSDPPSGLPRTFPELLEDERAVLTHGPMRPPFVLAGHSLGAMLDLLYMQRHPAGISGVVAMNPGPTYRDWIKRVRGIATRDELLSNEIRPLTGRGPDVARERVDTRASDSLLTRPMPATIPYVVMYAENCDSGRDSYCKKVVGQLEATQRQLARRSPRGAFLAVPGAGHEIFQTHLALVVRTIERLATSR